MVKQETQPQRRDGEPTPTSRAGQEPNGLSAGLREDLRALIARRAPALRELEKH